MKGNRTMNLALAVLLWTLTPLVVLVGLTLVVKLSASADLDKARADAERTRWAA